MAQWPLRCLNSYPLSKRVSKLFCSMTTTPNTRGVTRSPAPRFRDLALSHSKFQELRIVFQDTWNNQQLIMCLASNILASTASVKRQKAVTPNVALIYLLEDLKVAAAAPLRGINITADNQDHTYQHWDLKMMQVSTI